jgi:cytochrome b subunit of formate dehydrogenase
MVDLSKGRSEEELEAFYPNEILRHTLLTFLFISAVMLGVMFFPESFQKSTDEFASFQTRPPWFLLPFSERSLWKKPIFLSIVIINLLMIIAFGLIKFFQ